MLYHHPHSRPAQNVQEYCINESAETLHSALLALDNKHQSALGDINH